MSKEELETFEKVLNDCKISFTKDDGLYIIGKGTTSDFIQTKGYNLLYCVKRLSVSETVENLLK